MSTRTRLGACILALIVSMGCNNNPEDAAARGLFDEVQAAPYTAWQSPGKFATAQASHTLHGDQVKIYFNGNMADHHVDFAQCCEQYRRHTFSDCCLKQTLASVNYDTKLPAGANGSPGQAGQAFFAPLPANTTVDKAATPNSLEAAQRTAGIEEWPVGSIIVKEALDDGGSLVHTAIMKKLGNGEWFFSEYGADGEPKFSGTPEVCVSCHAGADHDFTFSAHYTFRCPPVNDPDYPSLCDGQCAPVEDLTYCECPDAQDTSRRPGFCPPL